MSTTFDGQLDDLVIANGQTRSRVVSFHLETSDAVGLCILAPATLAEAITFECSDEPTFTVPRTVMEGSPPAALTGPGAGEARTYFTLPIYPFWRLKANGAVGAARTFKFFKIFRA